MSTTVLKRQYYLLGKLVTIFQPDVAQQLLVSYNEKNKPPQLTDYHLIEKYFCYYNKTFCDPACTKSERLNEIRYFIAVMLHLYQPQVYYGISVSRELGEPGFVYEIGRITGKSHSRASRLISEVVLFEKVYDDFRIHVEGIIKSIANLNPSVYACRDQTREN